MRESKNICQITLGVSALFALCSILQSQAAVNDSFTIGDLGYTVLTEKPLEKAGTVSVKASQSIKGVLDIPETVNNKGITYTVTTIADKAFYKNSYLEQVNLPDSIETIGGYAFAACKHLEEMDIAGGVTSIGEYAFAACESLVDVWIPDNVESIGNYAFYKCKSLEMIDMYNAFAFIEANEITIGDYAFADCPNLTDVILTDNVVSIGKYAFSYCKSLIDIEIPDSVTSIGDAAFYKSVALTSVRFEGDAPTVGKSVFKDTNATIYYNEGTDKWTNPWADRPTQKMENAPDPAASGFKYTKSGNQVTITGYTGTKANITIPDTIEGLIVTAIGEYAFYKSSKLESIDIPDTVTSIGKYAFAACKRLNRISDDWNGNSYIFGSIGEYAFAKCSSLESVIIDNVDSIGNYAFYECTGLKRITLRNNTGDITIGEYAFAKCQSLYEVSLFDVVSIGKYAFAACKSLSDITIPDTVTSIGDCAFYKSTVLTTVYFMGDAPTVGKSVFKDTNATIYYNEGTDKWTNPWADRPTKKADEIPDTGLTGIQYKVSGNAVTITGYTGTRTILTIPDNIEGHQVTTIGDNAFYKSEKLESIDIPDTVTSIGKYAFAGCKNLRDVFLPEPDSGLTIGEYAFASCPSIDFIFIPNGTIIEDYAFYNCDGLIYAGYLWGGDKTSKIGKYAFCKCSNLQIISISETVESIGDYAFAECSRLHDITLSDGIKTIGKYAFAACGFLRNISIPASVTSIGDAAFYKSTSLVGVYFAGDSPTVGTSVFKNTNATIYYLENTKGWTNPWADRPTQMLENTWVVLHGEVFSASEGENAPIEGKIYYKIEGSTMIIAFTGTLYESEDAVNWVPVEGGKDIYQVDIEKAKGKFYRSAQ